MNLHYVPPKIYEGEKHTQQFCKFEKKSMQKIFILWKIFGIEVKHEQDFNLNCVTYLIASFPCVSEFTVTTKSIHFIHTRSCKQKEKNIDTLF